MVYTQIFQRCQGSHFHLFSFKILMPGIIAVYSFYEIMAQLLDIYYGQGTFHLFLNCIILLIT